MAEPKKKREPIAKRVEAFLSARPGKWFWAATIAKEIGSTVSGVEQTVYTEMRDTVARELAVYAVTLGGAQLQYKNKFTWKVTPLSDEPDDALVDGPTWSNTYSCKYAGTATGTAGRTNFGQPSLLAQARTKEWTPITDAHDEAAKALFAFAGDRRVVEIQVDASSVAIAEALRKAAADERSECIKSLAEMNVEHWSLATESEFYHGRAVSIDAAIAHLRARGTGGA